MIELLVVIAIISLLVSILLPSLQKAKDIARQMQCATQLRSIYMIFSLYAEDHDGLIPAPYVSGLDNWQLTMLEYCNLSTRDKWKELNICPAEEDRDEFCYSMNYYANPDPISYKPGSPFDFSKCDTNPADKFFLCDFIPGHKIVYPASWGPPGFPLEDAQNDRFRHGESVNMLFYDGHVGAVPDLDDPAVFW
ncbi:MAG: prepilin-type N-terminal cleavage/methylation domain-containing protein [Phycisphaerae bacterium]|nr:prepilin-type N-terminal cleavage/methylation domain-containing protein [Phycisphaerae bacterium]